MDVARWEVIEICGGYLHDTCKSILVLQGKDGLIYVDLQNVIDFEIGEKYAAFKIKGSGSIFCDIRKHFGV